MYNSTLGCALALQAELDAANEKLRVLNQKMDRMQRECDEVFARNAELERTCEQLRFNTAAMANSFQHD